MENGTWFNLPKTETEEATATVIELTVPVKGRVSLTASEAASLDRLKDMIDEHQKRQAWREMGSIETRLQSTLNGYDLPRDLWWVSREPVGKIMMRCPQCRENQWVTEFISEHGVIDNLVCINECQLGKIQLEGYAVGETEQGE